MLGNYHVEKLGSKFIQLFGNFEDHLHVDCSSQSSRHSPELCLF